MSDTDAAGPLGFKPELTSHPVDVGLRSEAQIVAALVRRGYSILLPFGVNQRYDLVLDLGGRFVRAQCKTGRLRGQTIIFSTMSVRSNTRGRYVRGYSGEADVFLVFCPDTEGVYAVPVGEAPKGFMSLRISPTQNGQVKRVNWAGDYELPA